MPYSAQHTLVTVKGVMGAPASPTEIWQTSFRISGRPNWSPPDGDYLSFLGAIATPIGTFYGGTNLSAGSALTLNWLTAAMIGTDGKYELGDLQDTSVYTYPTPIQGAGSTNCPFSDACVVSLRGALFGRGRASNSRMYWPATARNMAADGLMSVSAATNIATDAATWIRAVNAAVTAAGWSSGGKVALMSPLGAGRTQDATVVRVGRRKDRQERRENKLLENYQSVTI